MINNLLIIIAIISILISLNFNKLSENNTGNKNEKIYMDER